ncbi:SDR family NAD(P)-dependent oxidoreductase [Stappia taiwanensis]|uniref:SDR family NAD(P)-dependent oxidoreductase n=1 Tax=Stappia taiwanensis TaxID=992267 RepID=A0A838XM01_9HYPH|nr:type I polyketide synthase [Stappia taiwanensis]MBA4610051.1 SDR family NAD(P)-dependent oxidoreductase [Stappia taiwanensis]GGE76548.1 polyketide synthase [Stappia taiwanensis]
MSLRAHNTAITGFAARLPGASTPDEFWSLLTEGRCSVGEISEDRFDKRRFFHPRPNTAGRSFTFAAGQIDDVWGFDPGFFGISPREAAQIDPQQRLLLQVVWEAIEHAGLKPSELAGTNTGVYVGASALDYHHRLLFDLPIVDVQMMTGNTLSIVSNRISYIFDLRGPSFTLDTACSSSLVALHQAVSALESGQIETAIVAGVNLLLSPFSFIGFARASMLSQNGLCRAFDANGDGYVRSEGAVALVLQRDDAAILKRHARIIASGINADGRTTGLSLPCSQAQAALLHSIYRDFDISPEDLAFIEAHGTGTPVGDPAEANALGVAIGQRRQTPVPIGSVKTNIGHLEPVSGLAGVLKSILALQHRQLPRSLHFDTPNPNIDFEALNLSVAGAPLALDTPGVGRLAGINSFGFGGTNAHTVIAEGDPIRPPQSDVPDTAPLVISARSQAALRDLAARYAEALEHAEKTETVGPLLDAAARRRDLLDHRLVILGETAADKRAALEAHAHGDSAPGLIEGKANPRARGLAYAFAGNGSQWAGMGQSAYRGDAAFREALEETDRHFMAVSGWSLVTMLFSKDLDAEIERTEIAQPLLFGLQVALVRALEARGLRPDAVIGHSVGEVAAAWCAGMVDLATATRIIHARSTQQEVVRHLGTMAALLLPEADARAAIADAGLPGIELSAVNSPRSVTLSGPVESIDAFAALARKRRWAFRKLGLAYPFHCALVDPIEEPLRAALGEIESRTPAPPFISTVFPERDSITPDATYWWQNVRLPVRFREGLTRLIEGEIDMIVEIGPRPILTTYIRDVLREETNSAAILTSLDAPRRDGGEVTIDMIAARLVAHGARPDLDAYIGPNGRDLPDLPHYPWQNSPHLVEHTDERIGGAFGDFWPLAGARLRPETGEWFNTLDPDLLPFLADHKVEEATVFPATGFIEMALRAALEWTGSGDVEIRDLEILRPLVFDDRSLQETLVRLSPDDRVIEILSRPRLQGADWSLNARASYRSLAGAGKVDAARSRPEARRLDAEALYTITRAHGLDYGPSFRLVETVELAGPRMAIATLTPAVATPEAAQFALHPALTDAGFHGLFALMAEHAAADGKTGFLPIRIGAVKLYQPERAPTSVRITVIRAGQRSILADLDYLDAAGELVARLAGARFKAVQFDSGPHDDGMLYRVSQRLLRGNDDAPAPDVPRIAALADELDLLRPDGEDFDPDDATLLLDALARTLVHHAFHGLAIEVAGPLDLAEVIARGTLHDSAMPLATRCLDLLATHELAWLTDAGWEIAPPDEDFGIADLVQTLFQEASAHGPETALLARLAGDLPTVLRDGLGETAQALFAPALLEAYRSASPAAEAMRSALLALAARLTRDWPEDRPLTVLLLGARDPVLARRLAGLLNDNRMKLVVTDRTASSVERLGRQWTGNPTTSFAPLDAEALAPLGPFDLVLACDALSETASSRLSLLGKRMAADGRLIAVERVPAAGIDLINGIGSGWWSGETDTAVARSPLRDGPDWNDRLAACGWRGMESAPLATDLVEANLILAHADEIARIVPAAEPAAEASEDAPRRRMLLLCDADGQSRAVASALRETLSRHGVEAALAVLGPETCRLAPNEWQLDPSDPQALAEDDDLSSAAQAGVVHLQGAYLHGGDDAAAVSARSWALTLLLRQLSALNLPLTIVAPHGARRAADPVQAAIWTYARVALNEYPSLNLKLIDIDAHLEASNAALRLAREVLQEDDEREIILTGDTRLGLRLDAGIALPPRAGGTPAGAPAMRLEIAGQGSLDRLEWQETTRTPPRGADVEIAVEASGLNFRDVMWALGLLPEEALEDGFAGATLGMECCGRVVACGPEATRFAVGDRVIAFAPACFASHVQVAETGCAAAPEGIPAEAAATIPVAFLTTFYALTRLAQLQPGETILIHGGAGGVGLAAFQIARHIGATVIATAGSDEKRSFLTHLGVDHVLDSRSLDFADAVMEITDGAGVEVVLNSLSGEAMERSIDVLKPFGRFLELGKRDYYANTHIGLRPFRQNLSYFGIDADQLLIHQPVLAQKVMQELMALFAAGELAPLPYRTFPADDAVGAFRLMQQAGHIGKLVLQPPRVSAPAEPVAPVSLQAETVQVVVGGFGGFGAELIRRLADVGARKIAVLSRRGAETPGAEALIAEMAGRGVTLAGHACDVTDETALTAALADVRGTLGPIGGVFHTAMVLKDTLLANLDRAALDAVLAPKVRGADLLDRLTRDDPLAHFVLFSSATTLVGNPGQANYVAANGYLEGLVRRRRAAGHPGLAIAWGAISDAGYLARNDEVGDKLARKLGRHALTAREALDALVVLMSLPPEQQDDAAPGFARIDWAAARRDLALLATPFAERLGLGEADDRSGEGAAVDLAELLSGLDRPQAIARISDLLAVEIARILRIGREEIDAARPLAEVGMDSLMALELRMAAERQFGIDIPLMSLANGATLQDMAGRIADQAMSGDGDADAGLSADARATSQQHLGEEALADKEALADVAAKVEARSKDVRSLL